MNKKQKSYFKGLLADNAAAMDTIMNHQEDNGWLKAKTDDYKEVVTPSTRKQLEIEMQRLRDEMYRVNKPKKTSSYLNGYLEYMKIRRILYALFYNLFVLLLSTGCGTVNQAEKSDIVDEVNPFIGASTSVGVAGVYHGLGKTIPGATTPFGMVQLGPNTITGGDNGSGYSYEHKTIEGFAFTQMSGIGWFGDLGNFLVMPSTGPLKTNAGVEGKSAGYRSFYDKSSEQASAGYYGVNLTDTHIKAEMTAAPHSGLLRFTFPKHAQSRIQIDLARRVGGTATAQHVRVLDDRSISGWIRCTPDGGGWGNGDGKADYTVYFYAEFSKPLKNVGIWRAQIPDSAHRKLENVTADYYQEWITHAEVVDGLKEATGKHIGFYTTFATAHQEQVLMKAGISFVDEAGAKKNLKAEIKDWDFDGLHEQARKRWSDALSKIQISGGTDEQRKVFYTALYRTMIDPRTLQDVDSRFPGGDAKIHQAQGEHTRRTIFSGWDVFRSQMPLQSLINPQVVSDLIQSLTDLATEKKLPYFERWEMMNAYSGCMIGNPAVNVLAEAYTKGIRNYPVDRAYQLAVGSLDKFGNGRLGYTSGNLGISLTLEYAYNDWCLSVLAQQLGKKDDAERYAQDAFAYRNLFDADKGWFRPKDEQGNWLPWPTEGREKEWYGTIECNPYQQGWFVPHDISGLARLLGGKQRMLQDLESFFEKTPEDFHWNAFYNHANEPVHHAAFLFNHLGKPSLTQQWTRKICTQAYHNAVEKGLVGNEDVGQMSAWYVLAASGIHPIAAADGRYEITSPLFDKIEIRLDPAYACGKAFTIIAEHNSPENIYIQSIQLNGKPYYKSFLTHADIIKGGELRLEMGNKPVNTLAAD
ncbi:GH92 family glycosyl hydrolase [Olivibacter sp. XZL3]|uniref:GH92 family glycosyl hydrolase n=1 Tax=Olivibacter sp. XZL3 TaxID=1735116 RepID=UPI001F0E9CC6|nr:GH92 family glycosyl hydrolase [Olivibacter sp. XZL3]